MLNQRGCLPYGKIPQIPAILNSPPGLPSRQVGFARGRPRFAPLTVQRYSALSCEINFKKPMPPTLERRQRQRNMNPGSGQSKQESYVIILTEIGFTLSPPQRLLLVNTSELRALIFPLPSLRAPRVYFSQGATVGGLCGGERVSPQFELEALGMNIAKFSAIRKRK